MKTTTLLHSLLVCIILSSCSGNRFLQQKYTHYRHDRYTENLPDPVTGNSGKKASAPIAGAPVTERQQSEIPKETVIIQEPENTGISEKQTPETLSGEKPRVRKTTTDKISEYSYCGIFRAAQQTVHQQSRWPRHRYYTEFESFMIVFGLIYCFLVLPLAILTGLVFLIFSILVGLLIIGSAAALLLLFCIVWIIADI